MKKTIAFSGSNSSKSINQQLIKSVATLKQDIDVIDLRDYDIPIYSSDIEEASGIPENIVKLKVTLDQYERIIISTPEHNGLMPAFLKNILDWLSRHNMKYFDGKELILLSTSPGKGGGASALLALEKMLKYTGATITNKLIIGEFHKYIVNKSIKSHELLSLVDNL